jgi:hypothetical protein
MGRKGFGGGDKDPYEDLDEEFKDAVQGYTNEQINSRIAEVAKNQQDNLVLMAQDKDLEEKKEIVKTLSLPYDKLTKKNAQRIGALHKVLQDNHLSESTTADLNTQICEAAKSEEENQKAKTEDQALAEAKVAASEAGEQYKESKKMNTLRIRFCMRVLGDRGKV